MGTIAKRISPAKYIRADEDHIIDHANDISLIPSGTLSVPRGGTGLSAFAAFDTIYASAANVLASLAGNATTIRKFLRMVGDGANPAAPAWDALVDGDIPSVLSANARVVVRKNTGVNVGTRRRLNLIEGTNVTLTVADDAVDEEVDVTITASLAGANHNILSATHPDTIAAAVARGDLVIGQGVAPTWQRKALGAQGQVLLSDGTDANWQYRPVPVLISDGITWTNMPAALTELDGNTRHRTKYDLTVFSQVRLVCRVFTAGVLNSKLRGQYSTDDVTYNYLDGATGPEILVDTVATKVSAWLNLPAAAKADVFLRVVGLDGDGVADPILQKIVLQFR